MLAFSHIKLAFAPPVVIQNTFFLIQFFTKMLFILEKYIYLRESMNRGRSRERGRDKLQQTLSEPGALSNPENMI